MARQFVQHLPSAAVPNPGGAIKTARGQLFAIMAKGQAEDLVFVALELALFAHGLVWAPKGEGGLGRLGYQQQGSQQSQNVELQGRHAPEVFSIVPYAWEWVSA